MCFRITCDQCGRETWGGCGAHIEEAMSGVTEQDRCPGHDEDVAA
jgi:hypothetical protein